MHPGRRPRGGNGKTIMAFGICVSLAALAAAFSLPALAAEPADRQFERLAATAEPERAALAGSRIEVDIDLAASSGFSIDTDPGGARVLYPMAFNNIAEGWSWRPQADPAVEDYYRAKFLPLQSVTVERGEYDREDKIGVSERVKVTWRYDYFLAFDNLYDFYPRGGGDDAGFTARVPAAAAGRVAMRAVARLAPPVLSESTTFWKAIYGKPTDFTLKKRYLVGVLEEIRFVDRGSGEVLAAVRPQGAQPQR